MLLPANNQQPTPANPMQQKVAAINISCGNIGWVAEVKAGMALKHMTQAFGFTHWKVAA